MREPAPEKGSPRLGDNLSLTQRAGRLLLTAPPLIWLLLFSAAPLLVVLKIALSHAILASPPYLPLIAQGEDGGLRFNVTLDNLALLARDPLYVSAILNSLRLAFFTTLLTLLAAYPIAYAIAQAGRARNLLILLVVLPFWTSFLLRVYAWIGLLKDNGVINILLLNSGLISTPIPLLYSEFAILLGLTYTYLPFMILPIYATLVSLEHEAVEAAVDLGAKPVTAFLTVTLPLSLPGILGGSLLVFIPALGEFIVPTLLGGADNLMIGRVLWDEFFANRHWPAAAALALALLVVVGGMLALAHTLRRRVVEP